MRWVKEKQPWKAKIVHETVLYGTTGYISASKDSPVPGTVTHHAIKKIGKNNICVCKFFPDVAPDKCWTISKNWLVKIDIEGGEK